MEHNNQNIKVKCNKCNEEMNIKSLSQHLRISHNILYIDYIRENLKDFPQWKICPVCEENLTKGTTCSKKCDSKYKSQKYTGRKGNICTVEMKKSISEKAKIRCQSKEYLEKFTGDNNPAKRIEVRKKISNTRIERGLAKGENNGMYGKTHTPEAIKKIFSHRKMNKLEEAVAKYLEELGYKYTFQFFIVEGDVCKSYDFKLKGLPIIVESDGDFWHGNPDVKYHWKDSEDVRENDELKEKIAKNRGYTIIRIWQSEFYKNKELLKERLDIALGK